MLHPSARMLLRASSLVFHSACGGMTIVCLRYALVLSEYHMASIVRYLLYHAVIFGALAITISYLKDRYLDA